MSNENPLKARIQHLYKTEAEWNAFEEENPDFVFNEGELIVYEPDQNNSIPRVKFGNGTSKLSNLPFIGAEVKLDGVEINFDAGRITEYKE